MPERDPQVLERLLTDLEAALLAGIEAENDRAAVMALYRRRVEHLYADRLGLFGGDYAALLKWVLELEQPYLSRPAPQKVEEAVYMPFRDALEEYRFRAHRAAVHRYEKGEAIEGLDRLRQELNEGMELLEGEVRGNSAAADLLAQIRSEVFLDLRYAAGASSMMSLGMKRTIARAATRRRPGGS